MKISKEEFLDKYRQVEIKFRHYYKYVFSFRGMLPDDNYLLAQIGGKAEDIYRKSVDAELSESVFSLDPNVGYLLSPEHKILEPFNSL